MLTLHIIASILTQDQDTNWRIPNTSIVLKDQYSGTLRITPQCNSLHLDMGGFIVCNICTVPIRPLAAMTDNKLPVSVPEGRLSPWFPRLPLHRSTRRRSWWSGLVVGICIGVISGHEWVCCVRVSMTSPVR